MANVEAKLEKDQRVSSSGSSGSSSMNPRRKQRVGSGLEDSAEESGRSTPRGDFESHMVRLFEEDERRKEERMEREEEVRALEEERREREEQRMAREEERRERREVAERERMMLVLERQDVMQQEFIAMRQADRDMQCAMMRMMNAQTALLMRAIGGLPCVSSGDVTKSSASELFEVGKDS